MVYFSTLVLNIMLQDVKTINDKKKIIQIINMIVKPESKHLFF